jgi:hypothetical protein
MKLSREDLEKLVVRTDYFRVEGTTTIIAALVLKSGFCVVGSSACIDPADFDADTGKEIAYQKAFFDKLWELEGYLAKVRGKESRDGS